MSEEQIKIAKMEQCMNNFIENQNELKQELRDGIKEIKVCIDLKHQAYKNTFATKEETNNIRDNFKEHKKFVNKVLWVAFMTLLSALATLLKTNFLK